MAADPREFRPSDYQVPFVPENFLLSGSGMSSDPMNLDVVFVGGGPAGLAGAIELARLSKLEQSVNPSFPTLEIGVLEKSQNLGGHCLSGAVINPVSLINLFPELHITDFPFREKVLSDSVYFLTQDSSFPVPTPPSMENTGNYIASICELVRWMGKQAESLGVNLFTGFPAHSLFQDSSGKFIGVRTTPSGLDRNGTPTTQYQPPTDIASRYIVLSEGTRGPLTEAFLQTAKATSRQPQVYALGVKEVWRIKKTSLFSVIHTMGWPLPNSAFGGSFFYPMGNDLVAIGIVVGLDYKNHNLDAHALLQNLKNHPLFKEYLEGGEFLEWGAKTIPEGGFHALPSIFHGEGLLITGDAAGFVNVPALKGIHYAIESGRLAGQTIFEALRENNSALLHRYDEKIRSSFIWSDLYKVRSMRQAFKDGLFWGALKAGFMTLTGEILSLEGSILEGDAHVPKIIEPASESIGKYVGHSKTHAVYYAGNKTRDDIPQHLKVGKDIPRHVAEFYAHMCPAGVYELSGDQLIVNSPNCIDCKATDILGPRWTPREGGSGPNYKLM